MGLLKLHVVLFCAALGCSFGVIFAVNPVHSALFLILVFVFVALVLISFSTFLGITIVVVYVGAIAVLFLFVIMMLSIKISTITESVVRYGPVIVAILLVFINEILFNIVVLTHSDNLDAFGLLVSKDFGVVNDVVGLSQVLYFKFGVPIVLASLVLLTAMVSAISVTLGVYNGLLVKRQFAYKQHNRSLFTVSVRE